MAVCSSTSPAVGCRAGGMQPPPRGRRDAPVAGPPGRPALHTGRSGGRLTAPAPAHKTSRRLQTIRVLPSEVEALQQFSGGQQDCSLVPKAVEKLTAAAPPNKTVPPAEVKGAMTFLEQMRDVCPSVSSFHLTGPELLQQLDGDWVLHFSTFSEAFPYLPLLEIVRIDKDASQISVINQFGPLGLTFSSSFVFSATSLEFGFETLTVDLFGSTVWEKTLSERKMKWYNFYYANESMACVRSSTGALTLLFRAE